MILLQLHPGPPQNVLSILLGTACVLLVIGWSITRWNRDRLRFALMRTALEKGLTRFPGTPPYWLASLRQGVTLIAVGLSLAAIGGAAWWMVRNVAMPASDRAVRSAPPADAWSATRPVTSHVDSPADRNASPHGPAAQETIVRLHVPDGPEPDAAGPPPGGPPDDDRPRDGRIVTGREFSDGPPGPRPGNPRPRGEDAGPSDDRALRDDQPNEAYSDRSRRDGAPAGHREDRPPPAPLTPEMEQWHAARAQQTIGLISIGVGFILVLVGIVRVGFAKVEQRVTLESERETAF